MGVASCQRWRPDDDWLAEGAALERGLGAGALIVHRGLAQRGLQLSLIDKGLIDKGLIDLALAEPVAIEARRVERYLQLEQGLPRRRREVPTRDAHRDDARGLQHREQSLDRVEQLRAIDVRCAGEVIEVAVMQGRAHVAVSRGGKVALGRECHAKEDAPGGRARARTFEVVRTQYVLARPWARPAWRAPRAPTRLFTVRAGRLFGLILIAKERGFDAVVFVRDSDGDAQRAVEIDAAIAVSHEVIVGAPRVAGAAAVQSLEAWLLALAGESRTESMSAAKLEATLVERGTRYKCTSDYVAIIEARRGAEPPHDALSLRAFQERVRAALLDDE